MAESDKQSAEVVEQGDIYFFVRPDVNKDDIKGMKDIQRFYLLLNPDGKSKFREIVVGQKKMPKTGRHQKYFAFVDHIYRTATEVRKGLEGGEYSTKTRGEQQEMPARAVGEGRYAIAQHEDHSHLAYSLEIPKKPEKAQKDLNISDEGSYIISMRNPKEGSQMTDEKPDFPKSVLKEFGDNKFAKKIDPKMLDHEHAEFILIGAEEDPEEELGIELDTQKESISQSELVKVLKIEKGNKRLKPAEEGKWV